MGSAGGPTRTEMPTPICENDVAEKVKMRTANNSPRTTVRFVFITHLPNWAPNLFPKADRSRSQPSPQHYTLCAEHAAANMVPQTQARGLITLLPFKP